VTFDSELQAQLTGKFGDLDTLAMPMSDDLENIPQSELNPLTAEKIELGRLLYHETAMAQGSTTGNPESFSCASCHFAEAGFQANIAQGVADGGRGFSPRENMAGEASDIQPIRSPSAMNGAFQELMLWNGQFGGLIGNTSFGDPTVDFVQLNAEGLPGLEVQAIKGLAVHRMEGGAEAVAEDFPEYDDLFTEVFDGEATRRNAGLAIAAFERTMMSNEAPFQRWLDGDADAMSEEEIRGALVFFGDKANCSSCHSGPALNSMTFHAIGMADLDSAVEPIAGTVPDDVRRGRGGWTQDPADDFKFKTPQLYNLADSPFYGPGATFDTLADLVAYKNAGQPEVANDNMSPLFVPLGLSDAEQADLVVFLETALYDNNLLRYEPASLPTGNCFPHNDDASSDQLCGTSLFVGP
jgi:cytochrome c peroxidase